MGWTRKAVAIFEPFFTTRKKARHGSRLSTVYGIVKQSKDTCTLRASGTADFLLTARGRRRRGTETAKAQQNEAMDGKRFVGEDEESSGTRASNLASRDIGSGSRRWRGGLRIAGAAKSNRHSHHRRGHARHGRARTGQEAVACVPPWPCSFFRDTRRSVIAQERPVSERVLTEPFTLQNLARKVREVLRRDRLRASSEIRRRRPRNRVSVA